MLENMDYHKKRRRVFIFAYHKSTNYYKSLVKTDLKNVIFEKGIFTKQFPIKKEELDFSTADLIKDNYETLVEVSDNFKAQFYNTRVMLNSEPYMYTEGTMPCPDNL